MTEKGILFIEDRVKELIKVKGSQVAPAELEGLILDHPMVADVCVVQKPDERAGELPKAFVVLRDNVTVCVLHSMPPFLSHFLLLMFVYLLGDSWMRRSL